MQRHQARLAKLGLSNGEDALLQIDVLTPHPEGFADPQSSYGEEAEQAMIGPPAQPICRRQRPGGGQQAADLLIGVEVWLCALKRWENPGRRHFRTRFDARQMTGEAPDIRQSQSPRTVASH